MHTRYRGWTTPHSPLEHTDPLELTLLDAEMVEQPSSLTQQHRDQMELNLVEQAGRDGLLCDAGAPIGLQKRSGKGRG